MFAKVMRLQQGDAFTEGEDVACDLSRQESVSTPVQAAKT